MIQNLDYFYLEMLSFRIPPPSVWDSVTSASDFSVFLDSVPAAALASDQLPPCWAPGVLAAACHLRGFPQNLPAAGACQGSPSLLNQKGA